MLDTLLQSVNVHPIAWAVVCAATAAAAVTDWRSRRIANAMTLPLFLAGLAWALWVAGLPGLGYGLGAAVFLGFPFILLFLFAGGGAGDAKLMIAVGPWVGAAGLGGPILVLLCVTLAGIVLAIGFALAHGRVKEAAGNIVMIGTGVVLAARRLLPMKHVPRAPEPQHMQRVPYGLAICAGVWVSAGGMLVWGM